MRLAAFRALRPTAESVTRVAAPPYDVVSRSEAARLAEGNPLSFLHVGRAEIDLPDQVDAYDERVYARARENLERLVGEGVLVREAAPSLYLYRLVMEGRAQVGVMGCVHVDDYERGVIRKHETTRPDKEDDRTRHVLTLRAHAEPVLLTYRGAPAVDRLAESAVLAAPLYDLVSPDGVRHTVWHLTEPAPWVEAFAGVPCAYVADGHHRSASAWRAAGRLRAADPQRASGPGHGGDEEFNWFPAALFPASQLAILAYNRVVTDLGGQSASEVLERLGRIGRLSPTRDPVPGRPASFCIYLDGRWSLLELPESSIDRGDPVSSLDVSLLEARVLGPVLGIGDQRTDKRIDFVGGIRGTAELERRVDSGETALAVSMHPTTVSELMAVSDARRMMPPKSTWFEPKLLSGLFVHTFD
jgi:uncharacterized protein (DUF1015 family)